MSVNKRGKIWWVTFRHKGKLIRKSSFTTNKREAEKFEQKLREQYSRIKRDGHARYTYAQAVTKFINEYLPALKPSSQKRYLVSLIPLSKFFEGLYLDEVKKGKIAEYVTWRKQQGTGSVGIRRDLACLSSMLSYMVGIDWLETNYARDFDKRSIKEALPRTRYLTKAEYIKLLASCNDKLKGFITFAVETGLRFEEQFSLEWKDVNLKAKEIYIAKTKTDSPRVVPLSSAAVSQIVSQVRHINSTYVFTQDNGSRVNRLTRPFKTACKNAGIEDLRWHDLRRTCGSWMLQRGIDIFRVSRFLGHKSVMVTERSYAFLSNQNMKDVVKSVHKKYHRTQG